MQFAWLKSLNMTVREIHQNDNYLAIRSELWPTALQREQQRNTNHCGCICHLDYKKKSVNVLREKSAALRAFNFHSNPSQKIINFRDITSTLFQAHRIRAVFVPFKCRLVNCKLNLTQAVAPAFADSTLKVFQAQALRFTTTLTAVEVQVTKQFTSCNHIAILSVT